MDPFTIIVLGALTTPILAGITFVVFGLIYKLFKHVYYGNFESGILIMLLIGFIEFIFLFYIAFESNKEGK